MDSNVLRVALVSVLIGAALSLNCKEVTGADHAVSCYTCLGRDMENCDWGEVCCTGVCFKLEDDANNLMAKGCYKEKKQDHHTSIGNFTLKGTRLPFANDKLIQGHAHFCNTPDFCNPAARPFTAPALAALCALIAAAMLWLH